MSTSISRVDWWAVRKTVNDNLGGLLLSSLFYVVSAFLAISWSAFFGSAIMAFVAMLASFGIRDDVMTSLTWYRSRAKRLKLREAELDRELLELIESEFRALEGEHPGWHRHSNGGGWVQDTAAVSETAWVGPSAVVSDTARVLDLATVSGNARVTGSATVRNSATVSGYAIVSGTAVVSDIAIVRGTAYVGGSAVVSDTAVVDGDTVMQVTRAQQVTAKAATAVQPHQTLPAASAPARPLSPRATCLEQRPGFETCTAPGQTQKEP